MTIHLSTVCRLAKTFSVKREKVDDDTEVVIAHLKIGETFIDREQVDELLRQPIGWSAEALFDELGAPRARLTLTLGGLCQLTYTGVINGGKKPTDPLLKLKEAAIDGVSIELTKLGALLSCQLSWEAAGDEVDDIADMLGLICNVDGVIEDGGQKDLLASLPPASPRSNFRTAPATRSSSARASEGRRHEQDILPALRQRSAPGPLQEVGASVRDRCA